MTGAASLRRIAALVALAAIALAIVPELLGAEAGGVTAHHLKHAALILAGIIAGVLAPPLASKDDRREHLAWLAPTVVAPVATMFVMWPTTYAYVEAHPFLHVLEHLVILALAMLTTYSGERYAKGVGGFAGVALELMAIGAAFGYGVILGSS